MTYRTNNVGKIKIAIFLGLPPSFLFCSFVGMYVCVGVCLPSSFYSLLVSCIYTLIFGALNFELSTKSRKNTRSKRIFCEYANGWIWDAKSQTTIRCEASIFNNFKLNLHYANLPVFDSDIFVYFIQDAIGVCHLWLFLQNKIERTRYGTILLRSRYFSFYLQQFSLFQIILCTVLLI